MGEITHSITAFSITTLSITIKKHDTQHNGTKNLQTYAECRLCCVSIMLSEGFLFCLLSVVRLNVFMLSVIAPIYGMMAQNFKGMSAAFRHC
jgi:hypothetical protein